MSEECSSKQSGFGRFLDEARECARLLPNKWLFAVVLSAWVVLFHFWGNITLGYVKTESLFGWMSFVYRTSSDDEHAMFIPLVVLALFWWKRRSLTESVADIWWPALSLVVLGIAFHLLGYRVQQTRLSIVGFFIGLYGMLGLVWGREFMKRSFFPMFLFVFCVPLGTEADRITSPLRIFATKLTAWVANGVLGIGIHREGTQLIAPNGQYHYEVAAACSGIRSLTAIIAFTTIYTFMCFQRTSNRLVLLVSAIPLVVVSNVARLLMIILAAEFFGQKAGNYVHENGWLSLLPYVPAIFGVLWLGRLLREPEPAAVKLNPEPQPHIA